VKRDLRGEDVALMSMDVGASITHYVGQLQFVLTRDSHALTGIIPVTQYISISDSS
jgi:hypothetical protein